MRRPGRQFECAAGFLCELCLHDDRRRLVIIICAAEELRHAGAVRRPVVVRIERGLDGDAHLVITKVNECYIVFWHCWFLSMDRRTLPAGLFADD